MESILFTLALLACPVGMGLMMWFMAKGMRKEPAAEPRGVPARPGQPQVGGSVEHLREEHSRLGAELERLEGRPAEPVASRS